MAKPKRKWPRILAMVLTASLLTGFLALALVEQLAPTQEYIPQGLVSLPGRIVSAVVKPFQGAFAWATAQVTGYLETRKLRGEIEIEYNKLKAQNDELIYAAMYNDELQAEIDELKGKLEIFEDVKTQNPIVANVTSKETSNWFQMFTIDKGSNDKIENFMAVINQDGLIGYVYKTYDTSAEVISIIDSRASVSGVIQSSREQGTVRGTLGMDDEATCRMYYLPEDLVPRPGDIVVTSGIGMPFPSGIKIGTIRESTRQTAENKSYVVIEPAVDFKNLETVIVLVFKPASEQMPDASDRQNDYVPSPLDSARPIPSPGEQLDDADLGGATMPPRPNRLPDEDEDALGELGESQTMDPNATVNPNATPTPNPDLDEPEDEDYTGEGVG